MSNHDAPSLQQLEQAYTDSKTLSIRSVVKITTNADRVELALRDIGEIAQLRERCVSFAAFGFGVLGVLVTASFKDFAGLTASVWQALFLIAMVLSLGVAVRELFRFLRRRKEMGLRAFISRLLGTSEEFVKDELVDSAPLVFQSNVTRPRQGLDVATHTAAVSRKRPTPAGPESSVRTKVLTYLSAFGWLSPKKLQEIGAELGVAREEVDREMDHLSREGIVKSQGGSWVYSPS